MSEKIFGEPRKPLKTEQQFELKYFASADIRSQKTAKSAMITLKEICEQTICLRTTLIISFLHWKTFLIRYAEKNCYEELRLYLFYYVLCILSVLFRLAFKVQIRRNKIGVWFSKRYILFCYWFPLTLWFKPLLNAILILYTLKKNWKKNTCLQIDTNIHLRSDIVVLNQANNTIYQQVCVHHHLSNTQY